MIDGIDKAKQSGQVRAANFLEAQLDQFCGMLKIHSTEKSSNDDHMIPGIRDLNNYCDGGILSRLSEFDEDNGNIVESVFSTAEGALVERFNNNLERDRLDRVLLEAIVTASSPFELRAIYAAIEKYRAIAGADLVAIVGSESLLTRREAIYWGDALTIYACLKFRHCDRGSPRFILECIWLEDECKRYSNVLDSTYDRLSPVETESIDKLLAAISSFCEHQPLGALCRLQQLGVSGHDQRR